MKLTPFKITLIILFSITIGVCNRSHAQFVLGTGLGGATSKTAVVELQVGYDFGCTFIQLGYITSINTKVKDGAAFNVRGGKTFYLNQEKTWDIEPSAGYVYILRTTDKMILNSDGFIGSLYVAKRLGIIGQLFLGANYIKNYSSLVFGIRFKPQLKEDKIY